MLDALKLTVLLLWPMTAWATSVTLDTSLTGVPVLAWLMVGVLSLVSGLAALLTRWREAEPNKPVLFATSHMLGSLLSGVLTFLVAEHVSMADFAEAALIAIAAFSGARFIDAVALRLIEKVNKT